MKDERPVELHRVQTPVAGRVLVRRPDGPPRGVLVGFHGYAETAEIQLARMETIAGTREWLVVSVQGLNRFYRGRSQDTVAGWMTRQDRELAIAANIGYVNRVLEKTVRRNCAERDSPLKAPVPLVYLGFSQGVATAFRAAVRGSVPVDGLVACGGDVPPELVADPGAAFPPALLIRGSTDEWYTGEKLESDASALRQRGTTVWTVTIDAGHEWTAGASAACARLLDRFAGGHGFGSDL